MTDDFWDDAEIIDVYTDEQAIEDGVIVPVFFGLINRITNNLLSDFIKDEKLDEERFGKFMNAVVQEFESQRKIKVDWFYKITIEGNSYFIAENGKGFTLMKPEDY